MSAIGHSLTIARTDVRRASRKYRKKWPQAVFTVVAILAVGAGGGYLAYLLGPELVAGALDTELFGTVEAVRGLFAVFWVIIVFVFALRSVGQRGTLANAEGVLTVVPTRQAVVGVLAAEATYVLTWVLPAGVGVGLGFAVSTGSYLAILTAPVAVVLLGTTAMLVGYPIGLGIRHVVTRFAFVARHKNVLILAVFLVYFGLLMTGTFNDFVVSMFEPMQVAPQGWLGDLFLLGVTGLTASTLYALQAIALSVVVALLSVATTTVVAARHWFADPALAGEVDEDAGVEYDGEYAPGTVESALSSAFGRPTAAVVTLAWRRAARAPLKLLYAFYPLLFLAGVVADIYQSGRVPTYLPYAVLVFVAWAGAVIFTLNPLGDQGSVLPATLLSKVRGRDFVFAHVLAGLVVAVPVGTVVTAVVAYLSPVDATTAVALTVAAPVVMVVASVAAVGLGMAFPRYEAVNVTQSVKAVIPSAWAFALFSVHLFGTALAAVLVYEPIARELGAGLLTFLLPFGWGIDAGTLYYLAVALLVVFLVLPAASYRYAVRTYDRFTVA